MRATKLRYVPMCASLRPKRDRPLGEALDADAGEAVFKIAAVEELIAPAPKY